MPHIDENLARRIAATLLVLTDNRAVTRAMGIHGFVVPADYSPMEDVLLELRLPPFDLAPRFTLHDVWARYRWQNVGALLAGGVILLMGMSVLLIYRRLAASHQLVLLHQHKLQESQEKFRVLVESTSDWIWEVDQSARYTYVSPGVEALLGYKPEEILGKSPFDLMLPEEVQRVGKIFGEIIGKRLPLVSLETSCLHKDGRLVVLETSGVPFFDPKGEFAGYRGIDRDITERQQTAQALAESEHRFKAIFNTARDGIMVADMQTKACVLGNRAICDMLGYQPEELTRLGVADMHPAESLAEVLHQLERQMKGEIRIAPNLPMQRKDGSVFYADVSGTSMVQGGRLLVVGIFHDVTERKEAEEKIRKLNDGLEEKVRARTQQLVDAREKLEAQVAEIKQAQQALAKSETLLSTIFNSVQDGIVLVDAETRQFSMSNTAFQRMLGYSADEMLELGVADIHPKEAMDNVNRQVERNIKGENSFVPNIPMKKKDGSIFYADINTNVMMVKETSFLLAVFKDITERKQAELALKDSEEKYRQLFEDSLDALMVLTPPSWQFTDANQATLKMFGVANKADFAALGPWDVSPERQPDGSSSAEKAQEMIATALREGSNFFEWEHQRLNGEPFAADVLLTSIEAGEEVSVQATVRDISERKQGEEAVIESENRLRTVLESMQAGIVIIDPKVHKIVDVNPFAARMIGAPKESIIGAECHKFICPAERNQCPVTDLDQPIDNSERVLLTAVGERREVIKTVTTIQLGGRPHLLESFIDISERRLAEEKISQLNKSLNKKIQQLLAARDELVRKEKLSLLGQVAGSVGHELRNPLAVMNNAVYFLQTVLADADETTREYLVINKTEIDDADRIVADLLDSVRTKPPQPAAVSIGE
ncbi:MAG: PAS domain S-box protein, partial [Halothiobacillus sp.]|nr:PAS domain S-box protein [Halothiobacillus sp.]